MGFEDALKKPLSWMRHEPAVFLLAVLGWLPGLLLLPLLFQALPTMQRLLAESNNDLATLLSQHGNELLQAILPLLVLGLVVLIIGMLVKTLISLALAYAAAQLRQGKPLSLSDALASARSRWGTLIAADILASLAFLAAFIGCLVVLMLAILSLAVPIAGILLAFILGLAFLAAAIVAAVGFSAAYLLLPAVVAEGRTGAADSVKESLGFAWRFKLQAAGFVVLVILAQTTLSQIGMSAFPLLPLVVILSMLSELLLATWTGLFAAEFRAQYAGKPSAGIREEPKPDAPTAPKAIARTPAKPDAKPPARIQARIGERKNPVKK